MVLRSKFFGFTVFLVALFLAQGALAACTNPAGVEGEVIYNSTHKVPQYCDDTNWIGMVGTDPVGSTSGSDAGLVGYWRLDETSGTTAADSSQISNIGVMEGGLDASSETRPGVVDTSIDFDGSNDAIRVGQMVNLIGSNELTISFWFNADTLPNILNHNHGLVLHQDDFDNQYGCRLGGVGLNLTCYVEDGGNTATANTTYSAASIVVDQWYHVVFTFNSGDTALYINGKNVATNSNPAVTAIPDLTRPMYIGRTRSSSSLGYFDGSIDDVRVYNRVISTDEITELYNMGSKLTQGLIGHWKLDETASPFADSSPSGATATLLSGTVPSAETGIIEGGLSSFDSSTELKTPTMPSYGSMRQYTVSAWINMPDPNAGGYNPIIEVDGVFYIYVGWNLNRVRFTSRGWSTQAGTWGVTDVINANTWHHVAATFDTTQPAGTKPTIYIDGVEYSNPSTAFASSGTYTPPASAIAEIGGANISSNRSFAGKIDDVRIYDRILSTQEVVDLYNAREGRIRYNFSERTPEYFDGENFISMRLPFPEPGNAPISSYNLDTTCSSIGDVCSDGSVYAGVSPDGNVPMYASRCDEGQTWSGASCTGSATGLSWGDGSLNYSTLSTSSQITGEYNTERLVIEDSNAFLSGKQPHNAGIACYNSSAHGNNDWYLPATNELSILYTNRGSIANFDSGRHYWGSTQNAFNNAEAIGFNNGVVDNWWGKQSTLNVRCVRKADLQTAGIGGLVGHWKLDETTGTAVSDASTYDQDGVLRNTDFDTGSVPGTIKDGMTFNGIDQCLGITPTPASAYDLDVLTLSTWVKLKSLNTEGSSERIMVWGGASTYGLHLSDSNTIQFFTETSDDGGANLRIGSSVFTTNDLNKWVHVAATYNGARMSLYIDGVEVNSTAQSGLIDNTGTDILSIGGAASPASCAASQNLIDADIDDARIYDRALSSEEITQLYTLGAPIGASTSLPQGCSNIGDRCDDGTIYAGLSPDGNVEMYLPKSSTHVNLPWNNGNTSGLVLTGIGGGNTGEANTLTVVALDADNVSAGFQPHQAAQHCHDLVAHGADDWYLPSGGELRTVCLNPDAWQAAGVTNSSHWSAREDSAGTKREVRFWDPGCGYGGHSPQDVKRVLCVRKGPAPRCTNPYGVEGQMTYNTTHDVVQYCDGARWVAIGKEN